MTPTNALLITDILLSLTEASMGIQEILRSAQVEGRDVTDEELEAARNHSRESIDKLRSM